jgi:hypothetical protein
VLDPSGEPVGAGFVIGPDLVASCAHVVAAAVRGDPYDATPPAHRVEIDLPLLLDPEVDRPVRVSAVVARWIPIAPEGTGDIAVLRVRDPLPDGARMPPLRRVDQLWDHPFRVLGFPAGMADGVWATGRFRGQQGTRWFQMQGTAGEQPIVEGFSGSPVWDETSGAVVGMTVATDVGGTTTAYLIPIDLVLGVDPELLPCPYRGLEPFGEEHASFYFGRDDDIDRLVDAVGRRPMVAVAGPSGAGKSSLVRAGLLPRLRAEGAQVAELRPLPGQPVAELIDAVAGLAPTEPGGRLVLVVDQFEELAAADPGAATELLERIGEIVRTGPVHAVLTLRSATLDDVLVPELTGLLDTGTVLLPPMDRGQLRHAIVAPAERAPGLSFEPGLVDRILDDAAAEPGQLPLVESLLTELWARREGGYLTLRAYEEAGGVGGVVATHAEAVVGDFDPADTDRIRRLFTALAGPDRDGRFVRRPLRWGELPADLRPLVLRLAAGRLVVVERPDDGQETIQLAHQALIAHWPRLRGWLTEDRDFLAWRDQVGQQRERWEETGRDDGALLRGAALATALDRLPARAADVPAPDVEFVQRSRARQRREVRRWRIVTAVLAVLALAAGTLSVVAISRGNEVSEQLRLANAELMAQAALANQLGDPATAAALALAAWRADPGNAAARTALLRLSMAMRSVDQVFPAVVDQPVLTVGSSDDGHTLMVREGPGLVVLTGARSGALQRWVLPDLPPGIDLFRMSPDGRFIAGTGPSHEVHLWDVVNRRGPALVDAAGRVIPSTMSISTDGSRLSWLSSSTDGAQLVIRDIASNTDVPHGVGPVTDGRVTGMWLTRHPGVVVEIAALDDGAPTRLTARSLVDGSTVAGFPADSLPIDDDLVVSCAPGVPSQAVVSSAVTGEEIRRVGLLTNGCTHDYLTERQSPGAPYLMEPRASTRDRDSDVYRITALSDGRTFDLTAPPSSDGPAGVSPVSNRAVIVPADGERVDVLLPAAASLMRLHAVADTGGTLPSAPWAVGLSNDQRFEVTISADRYTVLEPGTRKVLGARERATLPDQGRQLEIVDTDRLTIRTKTADHWSYVEYALPSLSPINRYVVTPPGEQAELAERIGIAATGDRLAMMADGFVGVFDRRSGRLVGDPINLATTPERRNFFGTSVPQLALQPGPEGEVTVIGPEGVELWNPGTGVQEGAIPLPSVLATGIAVDSSGTRAVVVGLDLSAQVLDLDRRAVATEPFLLPSIGLLKGFTEDGNIAILLELGDSGYGLSIWDPRTRREIASLRLSAAHDIGSSETTDGKQLMVYGLDGALPLMLPLTSHGWSEQLCRITSRPFTDAERALIPAGTDIEAPCS